MHSVGYCNGGYVLYTFVKTHRMCTTKSEHQQKVWSLDDLKKKSVNVGSLFAANASLWCGMLIVQNVVLVWGRGVYGEILVPSLNFSVNLKLFLKKSIKNIRGWKC